MQTSDIDKILQDPRWQNVEAILAIIFFIFTATGFFLSAIGLDKKQMLTFALIFFLIVCIASGFVFISVNTYSAVLAGSLAIFNQPMPTGLMMGSLIIGSIIGGPSSLCFVLPALKKNISLDYVFDKVVRSCQVSVIIETLMLLITWGDKYIMYSNGSFFLLQPLEIVTHAIIFIGEAMVISFIITSLGGLFLFIGFYNFLRWATN